METQEDRNTQEPKTTDNVLVHQALAGDQEAFEALVTRYYHSLFGLIYHYIVAIKMLGPNGVHPI